MKLLHIDSAVTGAASISRGLSAAIVARFKAGHANLEITRRDLVADPLDHFTLGGSSGREASEAGEAVLDEFLGADVVVIGAPMYNFTVASQLKAWIDRILVAGKTFRFDETGATGLAGHKRVIVAVSRGNHYAIANPTDRGEHAESYLRTAFGLVGISPEFVIAEGLQVGPAERDASLAWARDAIDNLLIPQPGQSKDPT